jgi:hypothetical protein
VTRMGLNVMSSSFTMGPAPLPIERGAVDEHLQVIGVLQVGQRPVPDVARSAWVYQLDLISEIYPAVCGGAKLVQVRLAHADKNGIESARLLRKVVSADELVGELTHKEPSVGRRLRRIGAKDAPPVARADYAADLQGEGVAVGP